MRKMLLRTRFFFLLPLCLMLSLLVLGTAQPVKADGISYVRFIHAIAKQGPIDLFIDGQNFKSQIPFAVLSDYVNIPAGTHDIRVAPAGSGIGAAIVQQSLTFEAGIPYTLAVAGSQASDASFVSFADDNRIPTNGLVKVRAYHLSPDAGKVNLSAQGQVFASGLDYKQATPYLTVPAGTYTFSGVTAQGHTVTATNDLSNPNFVYSLVVVGFVNGDPKAQGVGAAVPAVVGLPNTGSNPHAATTTASQELVAWLPGIIAVFLLVTGCLVYVGIRKPFQHKHSINK